MAPQWYYVAPREATGRAGGAIFFYAYRNMSIIHSSMFCNADKVFQLPIVVCFAATTHKFQGATVTKPNKLLFDLRSVFDDAMACICNA